jgi:hypothetical protein
VGLINNRLKRLEERASANKVWSRSRYMERFLHVLENARREIEGREPLPDLPYTEEDRQDDEEFLRETLPAYRANPGWQTEEAQSVLDEGAKHTLQKQEKGQHY